jgi:hypothetical protein
MTRVSSVVVLIVTPLGAEAERPPRIPWTQVVLRNGHPGRARPQQAVRAAP